MESTKISQGCQIDYFYGQYSFKYNFQQWIKHWNVYILTTKHDIPTFQHYQNTITEKDKKQDPHKWKQIMIRETQD